MYQYIVTCTTPVIICRLKLTDFNLSNQCANKNALQILNLLKLPLTVSAILKKDHIYLEYVICWCFVHIQFSKLLQHHEKLRAKLIFNRGIILALHLCIFFILTVSSLPVICIEEPTQLITMAILSTFLVFSVLLIKSVKI